MYSARIVADSVNPDGHQLTTMVVVIPRMVLAEFNTHRAFSRNSASSRAIPISRMLELVEGNPFVPEQWTRNQPGMQGGGPVDNPDECRELWLDAMTQALSYARALARQGVHKQYCNRLLEPFMWHEVLVSSCEWKNFFNLRCAPDAQPEMRIVAGMMLEALDASVPVEVPWGGAHAPFLPDDEDELLLSAARCARISYLRLASQSSKDEDMALADRLLQSGHMSPFEHQAFAKKDGGTGNFTGHGWAQLRGMLHETRRNP